MLDQEGAKCDELRLSSRGKCAGRQRQPGTWRQRPWAPWKWRGVGPRAPGPAGPSLLQGLLLDIQGWAGLLGWGRLSLDPVEEPRNTCVEALAGGSQGYLIFLWKFCIFNFSFGILCRSSPPAVLFSVCCRGCREPAGHPARERVCNLLERDQQNRGAVFSFLIHSLFPYYCSPSRQRRLNSSTEPSKAWKPPGLLHCVSVLSRRCVRCYLKPVARLPLSCLKTFGCGCFI